MDGFPAGEQMTAKDFAYKLEGRAMRDLYHLLGARPSSYPFISGDSFRAWADHRFEGRGTVDPRSVRRGDTLFVEASQIDRFFRDCLPGIPEPFVLITHNGDRNIGPELASAADDPRILRWFAQNVGCSHPKLEPIPIGLENRHHHDKGITRDFRRLMKRSPDRVYRVLYGFTLDTNRMERSLALEALSSSNVTDKLGWVNGREYRKRLARYAFVASPQGNGIDCHRTWEALYLGVIPVVRRSPIFESLPGFPGLVVEEWRELAAYDEARLRQVYMDRSRDLEGFKPLWMPYWIERIESARRIGQ